MKIFTTNSSNFKLFVRWIMEMEEWSWEKSRAYIINKRRVILFKLQGNNWSNWIEENIEYMMVTWKRGKKERNEKEELIEEKDSLVLAVSIRCSIVSIQKCEIQWAPLQLNWWAPQFFFIFHLLSIIYRYLPFPFTSTPDFYILELFTLLFFFLLFFFYFIL